MGYLLNPIDDTVRSVLVVKRNLHKLNCSTPLRCRFYYKRYSNYNLTSSSNNKVSKKKYFIFSITYTYI